MAAEELKIASAFTLSLLGSPHCLGMCGGLALGLGAKTTSRGQRVAAQLLWSSGRTFTYAFIGAAAGLSGASLKTRVGGETLGQAQLWAGIAAGAAMILLGLAQLGVFRRWTQSLQALPGGFQRLAGAFVGRREPAAAFMLGVVTGFVPCGLVYAAAVMAATSGSVGGAAATMAAFGLGTVPALLLLGLTGLALSPAWRHKFQRGAGVLTIALGSLFLMRAPGGVAPEPEKACPSCVESPAVTTNAGVPAEVPHD